MSIPLVDGFVAFITNPSFGLPFLVLTGGLLVWMLWEPAVLLYRSATRETFHPSDGESVSRTYFALRAEQYSRLVLEAQWRLDALLRRRFNFELRSLPIVPPRPLDAGWMGELRSIRSDLIETYSAARRRDTSPGIRSARRRFRKRSQERFEVRLERFLRACDSLTTRLEGIA